jgi:glycogen operon protein
MEVIIELYFTGKENPAFVLDAVRFWAEEFHVDGIHLVGFAPNDLIGRDPYLSGTKLFSTSWMGVPGGHEKHLAEYNDGFLVDMRRALKGDEDEMNHLIFRSRRNPADFGVINYMANTNGFTLMDMVSYDTKHNEANGEGNQDGNSYNYSWNCGVEGHTRRKKIVELRRKQIRNAALMLFLSQGTPLLLAGDEFGNSKDGNNNSYCQDNEVSWLNWNLLKTNRDIYEFTKAVIAFRKSHPVFHMAGEPKIMDYLSCGRPDVSYHGVKAWRPEFENFRRQIGIMYCGEYGKKPDGTADDSFFVAYNMHWESHEFDLPNLPKKQKWYIVFNTDDKEFNGMYQEKSGDGEDVEKKGGMPVMETRQFEVPPRTIVVFVGK